VSGKGAIGATVAHETQQADRRPIRLAMICDFVEEGWHSMDLFGDMLVECYRRSYAAEVEVEQLRPSLRTRLSKLPLSGTSAILWNADRLINRFCDYPLWLRKQVPRFDLFHIVDHSYGQLGHILPAERTLVTCHDLDTFRCLLEPELDPRPRWFRAMAQRSFTGFLRARHVICPSDSTRAQLLRYGLFPPERISVINPGADPTFFSAADPVLQQRTMAMTGMAEETYILHVGSTIRRKRIDVLLRTFARVVKEFPKMFLVRAGGLLTAEQSQLAKDLGIGDKIVQAPPLTKAELAVLYQQAALLLQTSEAEGFGLPVVEAMACGCPVIVSAIASLREAGGPAAEYCAVADVDAWSETAVRLLHERQSAPTDWGRRQAAVRRHASAFTWPEHAKQCMAIYRSLWTGAAQRAHSCV
jgi:glycosyltransferase involved in cell wall biosynthesis